MADLPYPDEGELRSSLKTSSKVHKKVVKISKNSEESETDSSLLSQPHSDTEEKINRKRIIKKIKASSKDPSSQKPEVISYSQEEQDESIVIQDLTQEEIAIFSDQLKGITSDITFIRSKKIFINDVIVKMMKELKVMASDLGERPETLISIKRADLIYFILKKYISLGGFLYVKGVLEVMNDGYGFLRYSENSYLSGNHDVYVSPAQIRLFNLKTGDLIQGQVRSPKDSERFFALLKVDVINDEDPIYAQNRIHFDNLTPVYPNEKLNLELSDCEDVSTRIMDLFCPIGKGQRGLIVAPPKAGKTTILQNLANSITANHPEVIFIVLSIDERPEEVTDMQRRVKGEVIASTFDEQYSRHVQVAEMVLERAKRLVEHRKDVVILLDSLTRLARAYNQTMPASGKILSGGVDSNALHRPKRFFGAARNIEKGGSLTIVATALIETGSRMDDVIFEEFKGTGNMEIYLDRSLAEQRIFPAINIGKSGTRKEELLLSREILNKVVLLRRVLKDSSDDAQSVTMIIDKMKKTMNNSIFLRSLNS